MKLTIQSPSLFSTLSLFLLFFALVFGEDSYEKNLTDRFHICTVASHNHPNLKKLNESCLKHNIKLEIIGLGKPYSKNATKLIYLLDFLLTLEDDEIVMFVDAFDILIIADKEVILKKFLDMNISFLMSAEKNCYPLKELAEEYPLSPTPFRYINSGSYIGYVKTIKKWLINLLPIDPGVSDQKIITTNFLSSLPDTEIFHLDYFCTIFLPLFKVEEDEVIIDDKNKELICLTTGSTPCVLHANGHSFLIWNKAYKAFINPKFINPKFR